MLHTVVNYYMLNALSQKLSMEMGKETNCTCYKLISYLDLDLNEMREEVEELLSSFFFAGYYKANPCAA